MAKTQTKRERWCISAPELRAASEDDKPVIEGYAAVFNSESEEMWGFREFVAPGAFARSIKEKRDVRALIDHDSSKILGRTKAGTLKLKEDDIGLKATIRPPKTNTAAEIVENIRAGNVDQMSFAFSVVEETIHHEDDDKIVRELTDVDLFDVSVVTYPAYSQTSVGVRKVGEMLGDERLVKIAGEYEDLIAKSERRMGEPERRQLADLQTAFRGILASRTIVPERRRRMEEIEKIIADLTGD
ncbi:MAG: HK97 family phage prohead protease [Planctomycetota bacterium]|jgi:HK97 family phage prohead protease